MRQAALLCCLFACAPQQRPPPAMKPAVKREVKPAVKPEEPPPAPPVVTRHATPTGALELARQTDVRGFARALALHPAGRLLAFGSLGPPLTVFDTRAGKIL